MAPYQRIADEIEQRIRSGRLGPGDRVPSGRQITAEWGVAIATATRVLAELSRRGLVKAVPGVGTVVLGSTRPRSAGRSRPEDGEELPARIVRTAVEIADAEGYPAVSMRRIGAALNVPTMSLYRHVPGKEELNLRMIDMAMDVGPWPDPPPRGWRARLEYVARRQRAAGRTHPWLGRVISFSRPQLAPNAMAHTEWAMAALRGLGLTVETQLFIAILLASYVQGSAVNLESETEALRDTGLDSDQWMQAQERRFAAMMATGRFPTMATILDVPEFDLNLDTLFEFGLAIVLDGIAALIRREGGKASPADTRAPR